jgi:hypothetical protein
MQKMQNVLIMCLIIYCIVLILLYTYSFGCDLFKGRWQRKMSDVGKNTVIQVLYGIVAIVGYFKFEHAVSL